MQDYKRSINYLKRIRSSNDVPQSLKDLLPRDLQILKGQVENQITTMRNAIEHLENDIQNGQHPLGEPFAVTPQQDCLQLGNHKITFSDLAGWIEELFKTTLLSRRLSHQCKSC